MKTTTFKEMAIILLCLSLIFVFGCKETNNLVDQESSYEQQSLAKKDKDLDKGIYTTSEKIDGKKGGTVTLKVSMDKSSGTKSEVKLDIPKGAFEGTEDISISIFPDSPVVEFSPHGLIFEKELELDVKLENFWFGEEDQLDFVYLGENENEPVEYESLSYNYNKNYIKVKKAMIGHFSRYGFVK